MLYIKLLFSFSLCLLLTACATYSEVKKEDRDLSNSFDGEWVAIHQTTTSAQKYGNWSFTCSQLTIPVKLEIENSVLQVQINYSFVTHLKAAYISSAGKFKIALPTGFKGKTSPQSDIDHSDIETRFIIEGNLKPEGRGAGNFIIGWATSGYKGCKTKSDFTRI